MTQLLSGLKARAGQVKKIEAWTYLLISVGIPAIFFMYSNLKATITVAIAIQIVLGLLTLRNQE